MGDNCRVYSTGRGDITGTKKIPFTVPVMGTLGEKRNKLDESQSTRMLVINSVLENKIAADGAEGEGMSFTRRLLQKCNQQENKSLPLTALEVEMNSGVKCCK